MARKLLDGTNIDAASGDYPYGRVRDRVGATLGTIYNENLHGDVLQHFQKLMDDAGITPNSLPDNVTNGYQIMAALVDKIKNTTSYRKQTKTIDNSSITTTELSVASFVLDASNNYNDFKQTVSVLFNPPSTTGATSTTFRFYNGATLIGSIPFSYALDGGSKIFNWVLAGNAYVAGDTIKVTAQTTSSSITIGATSMIVDTAYNV